MTLNRRIWGAITVELAVKIGGAVFTAAVILWGASAAVASIKAEIVSNRELTDEKLKSLTHRIETLERRTEMYLKFNLASGQ